MDSEVEELEFQSEETEKSFLNEFDDDAADFEPSSTDVTSDNEAALLAGGTATVTVVLGVVEQGLKQFGHKDFALSDEESKNLAEKAAPLFVKYNGEMPPWLVEYQHEIMTLFAIGGLGFSSFQQIKELKAIDAAKDVTQNEQEPGEQHDTDV